MLLSQVLGSSVSVWSSDKWITSVTLALNIFVFTKMSSFYLQKVREEVSEGAVSFHFLQLALFDVVCVCVSHVHPLFTCQLGSYIHALVSELWEGCHCALGQSCFQLRHLGNTDLQHLALLGLLSLSFFFSFKSLEAQELSSGPQRIRWVFLVRSAVWR